MTAQPNRQVAIASVVDEAHAQITRGESYFVALDLLSAVSYLVERMEMAADYGGFTGKSSDALVLTALTGEGPWVTDYPRDRSDWRRCLLAYLLAPPWLRERMRPTLRAYRDQLRPEYRRWSLLWQHPRASFLKRREAARA